MRLNGGCLDYHIRIVMEESSEPLSPVNDENGRIEIWALRDFGWVLPIRVTWFDQNDVAAVDFDPGIPMLDRQKQVIAETLSGMGEFRNGHWWVLAKMLKIHASKSDKSAEDIVRWTPGALRFNADGNINTEFEKHLVNRGLYDSTYEAHLHWLNMQKAAADWMINRKRPLYFYCCTLVPVPYRANWKESLLVKDMELNPLIDSSKSSGSWVDESSYLKRLASVLRSGFLLAYDEIHDRLHWSLEVDYHSTWDDMIARSENETIEKHTSKTYAVYVQGILRHFETIGDRLYRQFRAAIKRPQVIFDTRGIKERKVYMRKPKPYRKRNQGPCLEVLPISREAPLYPIVCDPDKQRNCVAGEVPATD